MTGRTGLLVATADLRKLDALRGLVARTPVGDTNEGFKIGESKRAEFPWLVFWHYPRFRFICLPPRAKQVGNEPGPAVTLEHETCRCPLTFGTVLHDREVSGHVCPFQVSAVGCGGTPKASSPVSVRERNTVRTLPWWAAA